MKINKRMLFYAIATVTSVIPYIKLFSKTLFQADSNFYFGKTINIFNNQYLWNIDNLGHVNTISISYIFPVGTYFRLMEFIKIPSNISQLVLLFTLTLISILCFARVCEIVLSIKVGSIANMLASLFYFFNVYVASQLDDAFLFVIAHCLTSVFLLLVARGNLYKDFRYYIAASALLSFIATTNLVFCGTAIIASFIICALQYKTSIHKVNVLIKNYAILLGLFILLVSWILTAMIATTFYGGSEISAVLKSESFYNRDSGILNVLRMLGDWSFFGSYNGNRYVDYSIYFQKFFVLSLGLFMPLIMLATLVYKKRVSRTILILTLFLIINFIIIGGTNKYWITSELISNAFDRITFLNIFRNTYKFTSITAIIYSLIIAYFFSNVRLNYFLKYLVIILVLLPSFPLLLNLVYDGRTLINQPPDYWREASVVMNSTPPGSRMLLLPDQYFSVYNWESGGSVPGNYDSSQFNFPVVSNTCKGCAPQKSAELTELIVKNYDNDAFIKLLQQTSIDSILQRNDFLYGFYTNDTPEKINNVLQGGILDLKLDKKIGELDFYNINNSLATVYSPKDIKEVTLKDTMRALKDRDILLDSAMLVDENTENDREQMKSSFKSLNYENALIKRGLLELGSSDGNSKSAIEIRNDAYSINTPSIQINQGKSSILDISNDNNLTILNESIIRDRSIGNASNCRAISNNVTLEYTASSATSKNVLYADKDMGCINYALPNIKNNTTYLVSFDISVVKGKVFGYCISFDGIKCEYADYIAGSKTSSVYKVLFDTGDKAIRDPKIFIYAPAFYEESSIEFSDVNLAQVKYNNELKNVDVKNYDNLGLSIETEGIEQLTDVNFTSNKWFAEDKSCGGTNEFSKFNTQISEDGLTLFANNALACTYIDNIIVSANTDYLLTIKSAVSKGDDFSLCLYSNGGCLTNQIIKAENQNLNEYTVLFRPNQTSTNAQLYLYSGSSNVSEVRFTDISLKRIKNYSLPRMNYIKTSDVKPSQYIITNYERANPSDLRFNITGNSIGYIVFQESFSNGWSLEINQVATNSKDHFVANHFANGWFFDIDKFCTQISTCSKDNSGNYIVDAKITFLPQKYVPYGIIISGTTLVGVVGYLVYVTIHRRKTHYSISHKPKHQSKK